MVYGSETRLLSKQQESAIQATKNEGAKKNSREEKGGQGEKCGD